ncbi:MAG: hypothetical protein VX341_02555 [Bdellovibrionota bacterium]|nr:hypothetical protein [Bdellovibrionota bacterium]
MSENTGRVLFLELNEFNKELLKKSSEQLGLKNLQKILSLNETVAETEDTYDSDYLEPWVQWVSVHTGKRSQDHKVKHLGDVPDLTFPQVWEQLGQAGVSTGVWGVLNGSLGNTPNNKFFFPDPWTFSEEAKPSDLNPLLELPRYMAQNRMKMSKIKLLFLACRFMMRLLLSGAFFQFFIELPRALRMILKYPKSEFAGFCFAEYLLGLLFIEHWNKYKPDFGILFVNSLAHLQHYYWNGFEYKNNEKLAYGLYYIDKLAGRLLNTLDLSKDKIVMANALSQMNTNHEEPWISYRPKDHMEFLTTAGLSIKNVEPLMSYDALLFFDTEEDAEKAYDVLEKATVNGKPLFLVEKYNTNKKKLFYRFQYYSPVTSDTVAEINGHKLNFNEHFSMIIQRTGKHIQRSSVYSNDSELPKTIWNHEIFDYFVCKFTNKKFETQFARE